MAVADGSSEYAACENNHGLQVGHSQLLALLWLLLLAMPRWLMAEVICDHGRGGDFLLQRS